MRSRQVLSWAGAIAVCAAIGLAASWPTSLGRERMRADSAFSVGHTELGPSAARTLTAASWTGRRYTTPSGETVAVYVAEGYLDGEAAGQRWADFFASLLHDDELALLRVYVVPPTSASEMCASDQAIGCYGGSQLVIPGEPAEGVAPEAVARHEYGHHIAANRQNVPWKAIDWGTKRWATAAKVCSRVGEGTAFPGDEGDHYSQNPGEAFAEAYRVLNEVKAGVSSTEWSIVDTSFYPDQKALEAVEADVVQPWSSRTTSVARLQFSRKGKRTRTLPITAGLDGDLAVTVSFARGSLFDVDLLAANGKRILARGKWSGAARKRVTLTICGERPLTLRIVRRGAPGRITVTTSVP
jgi:hypothetical protein